MGTTVSSLQILDVPLEDVRAALPRALVGQWSARFVTACLDDTFFQQLDRKAGALSKKLACTVLSVSMFDGDTLTLTLCQDGKRLTRHVVSPESGENIAGNPKLFCAALGLPDELVPKLRRMFTGCVMQEEKLGILQALLGAPLFLRYGDDKEGLLPEEPVEADSRPLEEWVEEHPAPPKPPKVKNQCKAELIQEIPDLCFHGYFNSTHLLFRPLFHVRDEDEREREWLKERGHKDEEILGVLESGGKLGRPLPDGRLELTPLEDPHISRDLMKHLFGKKDILFNRFAYAAQGDRLVTAACLSAESGFQSYSSYQTVVLRDTAGVLPCPFPLKSEGKPIYTEELHLMFDSGLLAFGQPCHELDAHGFLIPHWGCIVRYGPDGAFRYRVSSEARIREEDLAALRMEKEDRWKVDPYHSVTDGQGRLWLWSKEYIESYDPESKLIFRRRLPGSTVALYRNDEGQACAVTFHWKKYLTRVYRLT